MRRLLYTLWFRYVEPCVAHCGHGPDARCCRCQRAPKTGWLVQTTNPLVVHIHPVKDVIEHALDDDGDCVCGPVPRPVEAQADDESVTVWLYTHQSADGREYLERGEQIPRELS